MNRIITVPLRLILAFIGFDFLPAVQAAPDDPEGSAMLQQARKIIAAYHAGQPRSDAVLRVVYFHPNDRAPLPDYADRLDRILNDVSDFYRDGLRRFGVENQGLPLERKDGKLVLHVVQGKLPASDYSYSSGSDTQREIKWALKDEIDMEREHVLVMYGLCDQEPDGRYVFHAPYYGTGSQEAGLCHAADCEILDPKLLTETSRQMVFTEHYYPRVTKTLAGFNTMYLGGTAHELGHGLGLFHDAGMEAEQQFGTSLMGSGNLYYRNDLHGGGTPAFLARVSALHLVSHPFFTGSNRGRWEKLQGGPKDVTFTTEDKVMRIRGKVTAAIPAYAVVAYVWSANDTDHSARTFPVIMNGDSFDIAISGMTPKAYRVRLTSFHVNGGAAWKDYDFGFDADGKPMWPWAVARAENAVERGEAGARELLTDEKILKSSVDDQRLLRVLRGVLDPGEPVDLATTTGSHSWVSDGIWSAASVGWGQVARNHYWFDNNIQKGVFLSLRGKVFDKGLYAHSPSRFVFDLGGKWQTFTTTIGLRDGAPEFGTAVFRVLADGKELYRSPMLRPRGRADVNVSVANVKQLELITEGGEDHNHGSWAIWCEPAVQR